MSKYIGLNVKQVENDIDEQFLLPSVYIPKCTYVESSKFKKAKGIFKSVFLQACFALTIFAVLFALKFIPSLNTAIAEVRQSVVYSDEYNLAETLLPDNLKKGIVGIFAPVFTKPINDNMNILLPFLSEEIESENGAIIFKTSKMEFLKCGLDGRVKKTVNKLSNRSIEVLCENSVTLKYSNLDIIGATEGRKLEKGEVFASAKQDVILEMFYKNKKIELRFMPDGKIAWVK